jgi:hypothetical protein
LSLHLGVIIFEGAIVFGHFLLVLLTYVVRDIGSGSDSRRSSRYDCWGILECCRSDSRNFGRSFNIHWGVVVMTDDRADARATDTFTVFRL